MKPAVKIGSLMLAVLMLFTAIASGCTVTKDFSYKTDKKELAIGIYIYELSEAYFKAQDYAEKLDDYDAAKDSWLDMEITDDDGNTAVARQWIKDTAERKCLEMFVIEDQLNTLGATVDSATLEQYKTQSKNYWDFGVPDASYLQYGYGYNPLKENYSKWGISYESFEYATSDYYAMRELLFDKLYLDGGSEAPAEADVEKYFEENYVKYSYVPVELYTTEEDEDGNSSSKAMSDEEIKKVTEEFDGYAKAVNDAKDVAAATEAFEAQVTAYVDAKGLSENSPQVTNTALRDKTNVGEEVDKAIAELGEGKATTVKVGEGESAMYYYVFRYGTQSAKDDYLNDTNMESIIHNMKDSDYTELLKKLISDLNYEKSSSVDGYDPGMFFVAKEPETTEAPAEDAAEGEDIQADNNAEAADAAAESVAE